jgi:hypothetical protein
MYRGVTLYCLENSLFADGEPLVDKIIENLNNIQLEFKTIDQQSLLFLNDRNVSTEIRENAVANVVSKIATIKEVRQRLVFEQQKMGEKGGIIMDGRDIASVVFPNAELKLFGSTSCLWKLLSAVSGWCLHVRAIVTQGPFESNYLCASKHLCRAFLASLLALLHHREISGKVIFQDPRLA